MVYVLSLVIDSVAALKDALWVLALAAAVFGGLAVITKGLWPAWAAAKRAIHETHFNLLIFFLNSLVVAPIFVILYTWMTNFADEFDWRLIAPHVWNVIPSIFVGFIAVFAGDLIGYWRHRLQHTRFLWPSHALHHTDTEMTWLARERFHPIDQITAFIIDNSFLIFLGFPTYALVVNVTVRYYYGFFIHADLPWSYGPLNYVFVSPVMHRWHHSIDSAAYQTNFAAVFSIFDQMFGTYRVPGLLNTPLGVKSSMGKGIWAQLLQPFKLSAYRSATGTFRGHLKFQKFMFQKWIAPRRRDHSDHARDST
jgi:sterol desaturase/sphingolipid hydroxylase (fatty acid hydroxylase superfamily)